MYEKWLRIPIPYFGVKASPSDLSFKLLVHDNVPTPEKHRAVLLRFRSPSVGYHIYSRGFHSL